MILINALRLTGNSHALPFSDVQGKRDLSYNSYKRKTRRQLFTTNAAKTPEISLQLIVAEYIQLAAQGYNLSSVDKYNQARDSLYRDVKRYPTFDDVLSCLDSYGYAYTHVQTWAEILLARRIVDSPLRIEQSEQGPNGQAKSFPVFLLGMILRRNSLSPESLQILVHRVWLLLAQLRSNSTKEQKTLGHSLKPQEALRASSSTLFVLVTRLLRHARNVWPAALPNIAALVPEFLDNTVVNNSSGSKRQRYVTFAYNKLLRLLSLPCIKHPVSSSLAQAEAQFNILAQMSAMKPPVTVTLEGYRAVTTVQLARPKTPQEQDWASLKARSWPPWKQSKTQFDDEKGAEYGISRAGNVMIQMQQAGYARGMWGKIANIYAGWDTDRSPTIQFRSSHLALRRTKLQLPTLWAARIRATRTLKEAWACFLAYEATGLRATQAVYFAMFEKIYMDEKRKAQEGKHDLVQPIQPLYPGDGLEVLPDPISPQEEVYVPTPPPTFEEFYHHMLHKGLRPGGIVLEHLVRHAPSLPLGIEIMSSALETNQLEALLRPVDSSLDAPRNSIPEDLITAFIVLIRRKRSHGQRKIDGDKLQLSLIRDPTRHVYELLRNLPRTISAQWNELLWMLVRNVSEGSGIEMNAIDRTHPLVKTLSMYDNLQACLEEMRNRNIPLDIRGFSLLCMGIERAAIASRSILQFIEQNPQSWDRDSDSLTKSAFAVEIARKAQQAVAPDRGGDLQYLFHDLVGTKAAEISFQNSNSQDLPSIPHLPRVPGPAVLHAYARALGFLHDYNGLQNLVEWIYDYQDELQKVVEAKGPGGFRLMRRTFTAIRAALTGKLGSAMVDIATLTHVKEIIETLDHWGGWPTEEQVGDYTETHEQRVRVRFVKN